MALGAQFDPDNIKGEDMEYIAENIQEYMNLFESIMVIPEDIQKKHGKDIKEALKTCKKLVKKLRNHDRSVFVVDDD